MKVKTKKRTGSYTCVLESPIVITAAAAAVGTKEGEGPLGYKFDIVETDAMFGMTSWEKAESEFAKVVVNLAAAKANLTLNDIDYIIAGDLLNQSTGSIFGLRETNRPYIGIFGACSAIGEGMGMGAMLVDGGYAKNILVMASSHFCSAEKQFRFPLEFGSQRPPTSTWTVTGAGAVILSDTSSGVCITSTTHGKMIDMGIKDANNMGAAMAAAAADTIINHLNDLNLEPSHYDRIITGDLGYVGQELLLELVSRNGYDISSQHTDCGIEMFDKNMQDTHSGGSGCGCSAAVFASHFYDMLSTREVDRILFVPTGALMSPTTLQQGESIPGIAHAVAIENIN